MAWTRPAFVDVYDHTKLETNVHTSLSGYSFNPYKPGLHEHRKEALSQVEPCIKLPCIPYPKLL
jgi:hypothetical protein